MAKKEAKKENNKNKKSFFKDFKAELKKVSWLTPKQLINNTIAVITIVIITAAIVFVLDLAFETLNKHGVDKIKQVITQEEEENTTTQEQTENENTTIQENVETQNTTPENNTQNNAE